MDAVHRDIADEKHPPPDVALAALAARQHGVVATRQLLGMGLSRDAVSDRVTAGRLHRVHRGVYAVGHRRLTVRARWMAAVLAVGDGAVLSHATALALHELRPRRSGPIHVTVPRRGRRSLKGVRVHTARNLDPRDRTTVDGIPVTTVARTLLDYAETARTQELRLAVEAAERREFLDARVMAALLDRSPGRRGTTKLREALEAIIGGVPWTQSELERQALALARASGLPEPLCNVLVEGELVDLYWPQARLIVEIDSLGFHRSRAQFEADRRRDAKLVVAGYRVIRLTERRLREEPELVAAQLRALLEAAKAA